MLLALELLAVPATLAPPSVTNLRPPMMAGLARFGVISFDVTDPKGIRRVLVGFRFPALAAFELAFDGASFTSGYRSASSKRAITDGIHLSIVRRGGWPANPILWVDAIDVVGNED